MNTTRPTNALGIPLLQACRLCGVLPEEAVYVGDGPSDAIAARAAGMPSVGITWNSHDPADVRSMGFDVLIDKPSELSRAIVSIALTAGRASGSGNADG